MGANLLEKLYYVTAGIFLCFLGIASWLYLNNKSSRKRKGIGSDPDHSKSCRFYLNIFVLNKEEVIKEKVRNKFGNFKYIGKAVAAVAGRMVTDEKFSQGLYEKMSTIIPEKLQEELGIESLVELEYSVKSYFVISVDIKAADARVLVKKKGSEKQLKIYDSLVNNLFSSSIMQQQLSDQLVGIIGDKLVEKLPEKMTERLKDGGGVDVEVVAKSEAEQSRYFFTVMKLLLKTNANTPGIMGEISTNSNIGKEEGDEEEDTNITYNDNESDGVYVADSNVHTDTNTSESQNQEKGKSSNSSWYPGKFLKKLTKAK